MLKPEQPKGITGDFKKVLDWADRTADSAFEPTRTRQPTEASP